MSYIDDLNQAASEALAASSSATDSAQIMSDVANGADNVTITTDNGEVKTVAKAIKDIIDAIETGVEGPQVEEQTLSAGQTTVTLSTIDTQGIALYIEGSREFDFTVNDETSFELSQSFPDGTRIWIVKRDIEGTIDSFTVNSSTGTQTTQQALDQRVFHVKTITDLKAIPLAGLVDGQAAKITTTGRAGDFTWMAGDQSASVSADEVTAGEGDGGVWVAPDGDKTGVSGAWSRPQTGVFNVDWYGAVGDGVTDDTPAFTAARGDTSVPRTVFVGEPATSYRVANYQMGAGGVLKGHGKEVSKIQGNGADPVILFGDGVDAQLRDNEMYDVRVENDGASCVVGRTSPNWKIRRCYIRSTSGDGTFNTVDFELSVRGDFSNNEGGISGSGWGLALRDNCNGQTVHHNQWSGGSAGGAITAGICQGLSVKWNIIESGKDGIYVSSLSGAGEGICTGVEIDNNYLEQVTNPIVMATVFIIRGWSVKNNTIGNSRQTIISSRDATFKLGRLQSGTLKDNKVALADDGSENLFEIVIDQANDIFDNVFKKGSVSGTPSNEIIFSGAFGSSLSARRNLGGQSFFDFLGRLSSEDAKSYTSPLFTANVASPNLTWMHPSIPVLGGQIISIEVIEKQGDLSGASLEVGNSGDVDAAALVDFDSVTFADGFFDATILTNNVWSGSTTNTLRNVAGTGGGTYRVVIRYRVT